VYFLWLLLLDFFEGGVELSYYKNNLNKFMELNRPAQIKPKSADMFSVDPSVRARALAENQSVVNESRIQDLARLDAVVHGDRSSREVQNSITKAVLSIFGQEGSFDENDDRARQACLNYVDTLYQNTIADLEKFGVSLVNKHRDFVG
jgi:hypothetical protein